MWDTFSFAFPIIRRADRHGKNGVVAAIATRRSGSERGRRHNELRLSDCRNARKTDSRRQSTRSSSGPKLLRFRATSESDRQLQPTEHEGDGILLRSLISPASERRAFRRRSGPMPRQISTVAIHRFCGISTTADVIANIIEDQRDHNQIGDFASP
jgi:hypothetical protein